MTADDGGGPAVDAGPGDHGDTGRAIDANPRVRRNLPVLLLAALWFLPINFAVFDGPVRAVYLLLLAVAVMCALVQLVRGDALVVAVVAALSLYLAIQALSGVPVQLTALLLAQLLAGIVLWRRMPGPIAVPMFLAVCTSVSLVIDQVVHNHVFMSLFAEQFFTARLDEGFRARGVLGQPVPAAHLMVCLLAYLWVMTNAVPASRRTATRTAIASMGAVTLYITGTRSALITAAVCILLITLERRVAGSRMGPVAVVRTLLVGLVVSGVAVVALGDSLSESRLLSFDSLQGTDSLTVRSAGLDFVTDLPDQCFTCVLVGHGQGALQEQVRASSIVSGVSTLDNQYLSFYWDFGVVGLLALLAAGVTAARRLVRAADLAARAGAVGVLGTLAAGAFYDVVYLSTGAILVGFLLAAMTRAPVRRSDDTEVAASHRFSAGSPPVPARGAATGTGISAPAGPSR